MSGKGKAALRQKLREVRADMEALDGQIAQVERDAEALRKRLGEKFVDRLQLAKS